jgi:hypothetical protein
MYKKHHNSSHEDPHAPVVNNKVATKLLKLWKNAFLPGVTAITLPSNANGVFTMSHGMNMPELSINGLKSLSPLANNAL